MRRALLTFSLLLACASNQSWRDTAPNLPNGPPAVVAPRPTRLADGPAPAILHVPRAGGTVVIGLALATGPAGQAPLTDFTLELVARGPDRAVEAALGEFGGALAAHWLVEGALLAAEVDAARWQPALAAIVTALRAPQFTAADVEALRHERLADVQRRDRDPADRARHELVRRQAPGHDALGAAAELNGITVESARAAHQSLVRAGRPTLIVVGDVPGPALRDAAAHALADWPESIGSTTPPAIDLPAGRVIVIPRPNQPQTAIAIGRRIIAPSHADDRALTLAAAIVGSALSDVLRRERGDTYSVAVDHAPARVGGLLAIQTQVDAAATGASLRIILAELRELQGRFMTGDLLKLLGRAFQIEHMLAGERAAAVAESLARVHLAGLPDDTLAADLRALGAVIDDDVERALATWFDPKGLDIVLVGDPELIRAQVGPLGLGPLVAVN